ncbi:MAG: hypothetical protein WA002_19315 [Candidatus Acidiferrales bacterium]
MKAKSARTEPIAIRRIKDLLDGRSGYRLTAPWGHVSVLEGGGHICELNLTECDGVNPLWRPPWKTIDPYNYSVAKHSRTYGPLPDGRLLAGIAGHNLSFDYFGPPSKEEIAAGHSTHGEASAVKWRIHDAPAAASPTLHCNAFLPEAQIKFVRKISADARNPVVYCEETARNLGTFDRPISWNEHVTFGPPFVEADVTVFDMPATRGKTCAASYSTRPLVKTNAEFSWPNAPRVRGGHLNLRTVPKAKFEHYTSQLMDPKLKLAFIAACNPRVGLLVIYLFRRADFPWVGNWVESFHQKHAPWNGKTFCRGLEFSTTPFAIPRRETVEQNRMFGERVYRWLPAKAEVNVRYMILLFRVPKNFRGVKSASVGGGKVVVIENGPSSRKLASRVKNFL